VTRQTFQEELDEIEAQLQRQAHLCQRALDGVLTAVMSADSIAAEQVIKGDDEIDRVYVAVEHAVESLLARQSPVAVDLRLVLATIHVNHSLERIGDQCVNVAKLTMLAPGPFPAEVVEDFTAMGSQSGRMIAVAMESFAERDLEKAEALVEMDQEVNVRNHGLARRFMAAGGDDAAVETALRAILIGRALERIGDNAVDIGERTAYLVTAAFREFTDASHPTA
jgi:phosphate transport system protein